MKDIDTVPPPEGLLFCRNKKDSPMDCLNYIAVWQPQLPPVEHPDSPPTEKNGLLLTTLTFLLTPMLT